jgi:cell division protein FtsL
MFAKLMMLILGLGLLAALLLVNRQRRYEIVNETVQLHTQLEQMQRAIQERKVRVAEATRPAELEAMKERLGLRWESIGERSKLFHMTEATESGVE